jgi:hypothetical protein
MIPPSRPPPLYTRRGTVSNNSNANRVIETPPRLPRVVPLSTLRNLSRNTNPPRAARKRKNRKTRKNRK